MALAGAACSGAPARSAAPPVPRSSPSTTAPGSGSGTTAPPATTGVAVPEVTPGRVTLGLDTPLSNEAHAAQELGRTPALIDGFFGWATSSGAAEPFPRSFVDSVTAEGSTPMVTWLPRVSAHQTLPQFSLAAIAAGQDDPYLEQWASAARADGHTVYLRLMHEMNGTWYPWGSGVGGNTPAEYIAAWRHVVTVFERAGAANVQFVWCVATQQGTAPPAAFFPGDAYVSWVAMDGYNRTASAPESFAQIFGPDYATLTSISARPVMIAETASVETPGDPQAKATWISGAFADLTTQFPRIKAVLYFDSVGAGYSYPDDSSPAALAALRQAFATPALQAPAPAS